MARATARPGCPNRRLLALFGAAVFALGIPGCGGEESGAPGLSDATSRGGAGELGDVTVAAAPVSASPGTSADGGDSAPSGGASAGSPTGSRGGATASPPPRDSSGRAEREPFAEDRNLDSALNNPDAPAVLAMSGGTPGSPGGAAGGGWSIPLGTFSLENHRTAATAFRDRFQTETRLSGAWVDASRSDRSIVWFGQYEAHNDPKLVSDLDRIRNVSMGGEQPFRKVLPSIHQTQFVQGSVPQYNLIRLREMFPERDRIFSLQIAFFEPDVASRLPLAQQAAEEYTTQLRAQGEPAFYYHGQRMSVVTVGVFFEDAIDPALAVDPMTGYGAEVVAMQKKFPYNLDNGRQLIERHTIRTGSPNDRDGQRVVARAQRSGLIMVPDR